MYIELILDGKKYRSKESEKMKAKELADEVFNMIPDMDKFQIELTDGGHLVLGKDALQRAHLMFKD